MVISDVGLLWFLKESFDVGYVVWFSIIGVGYSDDLCTSNWLLKKKRRDNIIDCLCVMVKFEV